MIRKVNSPILAPKRERIETRPRAADYLRLMIMLFALGAAACGKGGKTQASDAGDDGACYYRASLLQGLNFDHYLWQGGNPPEPPEIFRTKEQVIAFENGYVRPNLNRLPADIESLKGFLRQADQQGRITWIGGKNYEIYDVLQREIAAAGLGRNVHVLFGTVHGVTAQIGYFNELLSAGADGQKIKGVTHVVLEIERENEAAGNAQNRLDHYLVTGQDRLILQPKNNTGRPMGSEEETYLRNHLLEIAYEQCYNVVLGNVPGEISGELEASLGAYYWLGARDIYAVKSFQQRQMAGKNVAFWLGGASHVEKHRLPFYLGIQDPGARVISVVVNGGMYTDYFSFDRALKELGWLERPFILRLDGYREADYVLHIPTGGSEWLTGVSGREHPVLQQIYDPPE